MLLTWFTAVRGLMKSASAISWFIVHFALRQEDEHLPLAGRQVVVRTGFCVEIH